MHGTLSFEFQAIQDLEFGPVESAGRLRTALIRVLDFVGAFVALMILLPLMIMIAIAIMISDPGPLFFAHWRVGRGGHLFPCLKFRSMAVDAEARLQKLLAEDPAARSEWGRDFKLRNDPRITPIGVFLRKSSLDELPQIINVLRGEMSLVGPRPIVTAEVPRYRRYISYYYSCLPGITGLWQISGRNDTTYRRRVAMDVAFARSRSLSLYFKILSLTLPSVLLARGSF